MNKFNLEVLAKKMIKRIDETDTTSKDKEVEKVCGLRDPGLAYQLPWELDYYCPICGKSPTLEKFDEKFDFSEYRYFMYCPNCDIDIPSFLCLKANTKEKVKMYTERYLAMIRDIKQKKKRGTKPLAPRIEAMKLKLLFYFMNAEKTPKGYKIIRSKIGDRTKLNKMLFLVSRFSKDLGKKLNFQSLIY